MVMFAVFHSVPLPLKGKNEGNKIFFLSGPMAILVDIEVPLILTTRPHLLLSLEFPDRL